LQWSDPDSDEEEQEEQQEDLQDGHDVMQISDEDKVWGGRGKALGGVVARLA
jgi:hypothetical protein